MFGRKKTSAIDRRLQELRREMSKVDTEIKSLSRYGKTGSGVPGPRADKAQFPEAPAGDSAPAAPSFEATKSQASGMDDLFAADQKSGQTSSVFTEGAPADSGSDLPLFEQRSPLSMTGREKFANYFMAGHFSNLRPLRQEKRIIRNKAIVMIVLVVLALIWLLFFLHNQ